MGARITPMLNGCWAWDGDLTRYGRVTRPHCGDWPAESIPAHRFVYETLVDDEFPQLWHLHHECENPGCVNPAHLEPMTHQEHFAHHAEMRIPGLIEESRGRLPT